MRMAYCRGYAQKYAQPKAISGLLFRVNSIPKDRAIPRHRSGEASSNCGETWMGWGAVESVPRFTSIPAPGGSSLIAQSVKNLPAMQETWVQFLGREDPPGEGNGNPLQCSYLENPMRRGAWPATVHGVASIRHNLATKPTCDSRGSFLCCT